MQRQGEERFQNLPQAGERQPRLDARWGDSVLSQKIDDIFVSVHTQASSQNHLEMMLDGHLPRRGKEEIITEASVDELNSRSTTLPPGFRFHPTDEELVTYYLAQKVLSNGIIFDAIGEVDFNKCEPWDLPVKAKMGESYFYFFSLRDRKYPTGIRTNRATMAGYWKATGKDREVMDSKNGRLTGMKKTLVFYTGRAPKGEKTNWIMHEYRLEGDSAALSHSNKQEWVVCRVFEKNTAANKMKISMKEFSHEIDYGNANNTNSTMTSGYSNQRHHGSSYNTGSALENSKKNDRSGNYVKNNIGDDHTQSFSALDSLPALQNVEGPGSPNTKPNYMFGLGNIGTEHDSRAFLSHRQQQTGAAGMGPMTPNMVSQHEFSLRRSTSNLLGLGRGRREIMTLPHGVGDPAFENFPGSLPVWEMSDPLDGGPWPWMNEQ